MAKTVHSRITFGAPFTLAGVYGTHPAGTYSISTRDTLLWNFPFEWKTVTATSITICANPGVSGALQKYEISPRDLFRAIHFDQANSSLVAG